MMRYYFAVIILFSLYSCIQRENDIYEQIPKNSSLSIDILRNSYSVVKCNYGTLVLYDISQNRNSDYNPHMLFFNSKNLLDKATYFCSESVFFQKKNNITAYLNEYRCGRKGNFVNDIPNEINLEYLKYKSNPPSSRMINGGEIIDLKFIENNNTIKILTETDDKGRDWLTIPIYKVTFSYFEGILEVNNIESDEEKIATRYKITQDLLNKLFKYFI